MAAQSRRNCLGGSLFLSKGKIVSDCSTKITDNEKRENLDVLIESNFNLARFSMAEVVTFPLKDLTSKQETRRLNSPAVIGITFVAVVSWI
jgi:hypothetical protein